MMEGWPVTSAEHVQEARDVRVCPLGREVARREGEDTSLRSVRVRLRLRGCAFEDELAFLRVSCKFFRSCPSYSKNVRKNL